MATPQTETAVPVDFAPVFIVGVPRSGTTLLRAMLNRHPRIGLSDETYFFYYVYQRRRVFGDLADAANRRRLIASYGATQRMHRLKIDLPRLNERLLAEGTSYPAFFATILQFYAEAHGKVRPGEKTPHHAWNVETLLEWYPGGRVIHLVRDPRDVCASLFSVPWGRKTATANAELWVNLTESADLGQGNPRFCRVRYEDVVAEPEQVMRNLCDFIGESYDPAMLSTSPVSTADQPWFLRSHDALSKDRLGAWRGRLSANDVSLIESTAGPLMQKLGYQLTQSPASAGLRFKGRLQSRLEDLKERVLRAPRLWYFWMQPRNLAAEEKWIDR
ncbi:MAG TPA: sulfotransferase [Gemmatimonadales bacterium]|nr:sulfotransferase [Gemmatimonadales bacterium]